MKIAVPTAEGKLCMHFGHCRVFTLMTVDDTGKKIAAIETLNPPAHEPGVLPRWLHEQGATHIIAGGMGMRAQQFFMQFGIDVVTGAPAGDPRDVAEAWLRGTLVVGANACDH